MTSRRRILAVPALLALFASCGGEKGSGPVTPGSSVVSVTVNGGGANLTPGQSVQLTATAVDRMGATITNAGPAAWSSLAQQVATVDATGRVTAMAPGQTVISARVGAITGQTSIVVVPAVVASKDTVFTVGRQFSPISLQVALGAVVVFAIFGDPHDVTFASRAGAPANIPVTTNRNVPLTFGARGTFPYDCRVHPGMIGEVVVQ